MVGWRVVGGGVEGCWWWSGEWLVVGWRVVGGGVEGGWWWGGEWLVVGWRVVGGGVESGWWWGGGWLVVGWRVVGGGVEGFFFFFYFTYLPWEISVITGFHYLPANKYNGDVELHIQNNTKLNDGVMR